MVDNIKKEVEYLLIYFLIWLGANLWVVWKFPQVKDLNFEIFSSFQLTLLFLFSLASVFGLVMSAVYVNRLWKKCEVKSPSPQMLTFLFVVSVVFLGVLSGVLVAFIIWKAKKAEALSKENNKL